MEIYASDFTSTSKADHSPVTVADSEAEAIILAGLADHFAGVPVVAEEQVANGVAPSVAPRFFLVDPLDGTKEFISRNGEFTVNIALVANGQPEWGVVYAPAIGAMFAGVVIAGDGNKGAWAWDISVANPFDAGPCRSIAAREVPAIGATLLASRSHRDASTEDYIKMQKPHEIINAGSSLKFCRLAQGMADLYPRFGRTMEWDTCAGHAVLAGAGGRVNTLDSKPLAYGKPGFENPPFIASGLKR